MTSKGSVLACLVVVVVVSLLLVPTLVIFITWNRTISVFAQSDNFLSYENSTLGVRIQYPFNWNISKGDYAISFHPSGSSVSIVRFEPTNVTFEEYSVSVGVRVEPTNHTFEEYSSDALHFDTMRVKNMNDFANTFNMPELLRALNISKAKLSGLDAWKTTEIDVNSTLIRTWTVKDNYIYTIAFHSDHIDSVIYEPIFQRMIDTFRIIR